MTVTLYDQAYPNPGTAPHVSGSLVYVGGNTPHPWTDAETHAAWGRYRLPTWVRSTGGDPVADANATVAWLHAHNVPTGRAVVLDLETRVDVVYVLAYGNVLHQAGYLVWVYGSKSTLFRNPALDGYFVADYTQNEHQYAGAIATQWADPGAYDVEDTDAVGALWDYAPPAEAAPTSILEDEDMAEVWNDGTALYLYDSGWLVHLGAADEGSDLTNQPVAPFTARPLTYRSVHPDLVAALVASQAARVAVVPAPVVNVDNNSVQGADFPKTWTVTAAS